MGVWSVVLVLWCLASLSCCGSGRNIRIRSDSSLDFTEVSVAGRRYGDVAAGATTDYRTVDKSRIRGPEDQALNLGAKRFTYRIDVEDFDAGHLAIQVVGD